MTVDIESLMLFGGRAALDKLQKEAHEQGLELGEERGVMLEREKIIMNIHRNKNYSADLIADLTGFHAHYVQSVIDKFEKKE